MLGASSRRKPPGDVIPVTASYGFDLKTQDGEAAQPGGVLGAEATFGRFAQP